MSLFQTLPLDLVNLLELHCESFPVRYTLRTMHNSMDRRMLSLVLCHRDGACNEEIIGCAISRRSWKNFTTTDRKACLCTFGIKEQFRRLSLGTDLLTVACAILWGHFQTEELYLDMQSMNRAAYLFYTKFGFKVWEAKPGYYDLPEPGSDAWYMDIPLENVEFHLKNMIYMKRRSRALLKKVPPLEWKKSLFASP